MYAASFLFAAQAVAAPATAPDERLLLDTAKKLCLPLQSSEARIQEAVGQGWKNYAPEAGEYYSGLREYWEKAIVKQKGQLEYFTLLRGEIKGRDQYLLFTRVDGQGADKVGCRLMIPVWPDAITPEKLQTWSGLKPSEFMIGLFDNETRWQVALPEEYAGSFMSVSHFGSGQPRAGVNRHAFQTGIVVQFEHTEFTS